MFSWVIRTSLRNAWVVVGATLLLIGLGIHALMTTPIDVLPELAAPSVTVITETGGMAPDEVEQLVTIPLEQALNGSAGLRRIRSSSAVGISLVWVEFDWDVDPFVARQVVAEKLAVARTSLPEGIDPVMAPASSIMGEIMFVGLTAEPQVSDSDLRSTAEWSVRRRLLSVPGIAQVVPIGGATKQVVIELSPDKMMNNRVGVQQVLAALEGVSDSAPGGFYVAGQQEYLIRGVGRSSTIEGLGRTAIAERDGFSILLTDVANVRVGEATRRGDAAVNGERAVVLKVQKQPQVNTLEVTDRVDRALDDLAPSLPTGVALYRKGFRQADFIRIAIGNVSGVLRDGAILVCIVLALFLMSWRTTLISLLALPISLLAGVLVLRYSGATINTMTLGGFAIAIGSLVDDAIIDVENVFRRLRENSTLATKHRLPVYEVVYTASREIRTSIVFATLIIVIVFAPLFFLSGLEGRLLRPLGIAYATSIGASLLVAMTVTPVLCLLLLGQEGGHRAEESLVVRWLKRVYRPVLVATLRMPGSIALGALAGALAATLALASFGRSFLPEFNEGSLNIAAATAPGTSLQTSNAVIRRLEGYLVEHPAVTSVLRSTGRAERDEHALDVNFSELEVGLDLSKGERDQILADIRKHAGTVPGLSVAVGQPISHRIEHLMSGVRSSVALKIYGDDLDQLRTLGKQAETAMRSVPGLTDVTLEQQTEIPQLVIRPKTTELAGFGLTPGELSRFVETALSGTRVAHWWEQERVYDVVARFPDPYRADFGQLRTIPIDIHGARFTELSAVAHVDKTMGPNLINREDVQRRIVVTCNVSGRDLRGAARAALEAVQQDVPMPTGYHVVLGGEFEAEANAARNVVGLSLVAILCMFGLLTIAFRSWRDALLVMVNLPLALVGGVVAVWLGGGVLNIASMVGFVTLFGIAARNGIMLLTHYRHLLESGVKNVREAVIQGSLERLVPILMTALTAALALVPIVIASGEPGNELQGPMSSVILGGLVSSTLLNLLVLPALFARFGHAMPAPVEERSEGRAGI